MADSLDDILARKPAEAAPAQETKPEVTQETTEQPETPAAEATPSQETETETPKGGQKMVPHEALHAEKQKVKRYTEEVADFRKSNEALQKQVAELLQRVPVQERQAQQPPDWFSDPSVAFRQSIDPVLSPFRQQLSSLSGQLAQMRAEKAFGDKYGEFLSYVKENMESPEVVALNAAMESAPDPFAFAKDWFDKKTFDPEAERARIRAEIEAEMKPQQTQQPSVMPSNLAGARNVGSRSGPAWSGPPSLNDIFKR